MMITRNTDGSDLLSKTLIREIMQIKLLNI